MTDCPYENRFTVNTSRFQKKKLPVVIDGEMVIEDSSFIIEHLKQKGGVDLDLHLTDEQRAIARAFQSLCEKILVDIVMYYRWVDSSNWPHFREKVFRGAPWLIKHTIGKRIANGIGKTLYSHGMGRFSDQERLSILDSNLAALSLFLGDKPYFFGDRVSSIDAVLFSHLVQVRPRGVVPQFVGRLERHPNLCHYLSRMGTRYWPGLDVLGPTH